MKEHAPGYWAVLGWILLISPPAVALPSISGSPDLILHLTGESPCGQFGFSMSSAGDFNGDGYGDAVIAAPFADRAYVYFGGPQRDSLPDFRLVAPSGTAFFGKTVSSAGDFNADGFGDVVVGVGNHFGGFYVYYGGVIPNSAPGVTLRAPFSGGPGLEQPGAVAFADLNGDGYDDLVASFQGLNAPSRVFVYLGGTIVDGLHDLQLIATPDDLLGSDVETEDLNGDGASDVIVGSASGVRVYYGGPGLDSTEDLRLTGSTINGDHFYGFARAGDVNGDSYADIMVATSDGDATHGRVPIYFGGPGVDSIPDVKLHGEDITTPFGGAMASLGDVNADGFSDLLLGEVLPSGVGKVYLFVGGSPMDSIAHSVIANDTPDAGFAVTLAAADMNGDAVLEGLIPMVGSCSGGGGAPAGEVFVYDLSIPLPSRAFVHGDNRTIPLGKDSSPICIRFEPVDGSYENTDVDMSSIRLVSDGNPGTAVVPSATARRTVVGDTDGNGIPELPAWFSRFDLGRLFGSIHGRRVVSAQLRGRLDSKRRFLAPVNLTIIEAPSSEERSAVSPNPLNPTGTLKFRTRKAGNVSVRVFDARGRLVRTPLDSEFLPIGEHSLQVDGRDRRGIPLAAGIYFYVVETLEGAHRGRLVIVK